ncbi:unnamed protein product [Hymenolepis diminuta]|uniref:C2H2-type domain-containing protein n=1 Tax=Hymenolepis diminuta TaxID=6216 RepID=A0A564ZCM0_HYMDI|nr:unnamed protein product [Hymenolepis diminuta]
MIVFPCDNCDVCFENRETLLIHMLEQHSLIALTRCPFCLNLHITVEQFYCSGIYIYDIPSKLSYFDDIDEPLILPIFGELKAHLLSFHIKMFTDHPFARTWVV